MMNSLVYPPQKSGPLPVLPDELWLAILVEIPLFELAQATRVSRSWYRLATDSTLWTHAEVSSAQLDVLPAILARSYPLNIHLTVSLGKRGSYDEVKIYETLRLHLHRIATLTLHGVSPTVGNEGTGSAAETSTETGVDALTSLLSTPAPNLRTFTLTTPPPRVREVRLDGCVIDPDDSPVVLGMARVGLGVRCITTQHGVEMWKGGDMQFAGYGLWVEPSFECASFRRLTAMNA